MAKIIKIIQGGEIPTKYDSNNGTKRQNKLRQTVIIGP